MLCKQVSYLQNAIGFIICLKCNENHHERKCHVEIFGEKKTFKALSVTKAFASMVSSMNDFTVYSFSTRQHAQHHNYPPTASATLSRVPTWGQAGKQV